MAMILRGSYNIASRVTPTMSHDLVHVPRVHHVQPHPLALEGCGSRDCSPGSECVCFPSHDNHMQYDVIIFESKNSMQPKVPTDGRQ